MAPPENRMTDNSIRDKAIPDNAIPENGFPENAVSVNGIKAIFWDLDRTLYDESKCRRHGLTALHKIFASHPKYHQLADLSLNDLVKAMLKANFHVLNQNRARYGDHAVPSHIGLAHLVETVCSIKKLDKPSFDLLLDTYLTAYMAVAKTTAQTPDSVMTLMMLRNRGFKIGLVTNGYALHQKRKLGWLGIADLFDTIVVSDEVGATKPNTTIFEVAISNLGVRPEECVMVGDDRKKDVLGAKRAGIPRRVWYNPAHKGIKFDFNMRHMGTRLVHNVSEVLNLISEPWATDLLPASDSESEESDAGVPEKAEPARALRIKAREASKDSSSSSSRLKRSCADALEENDIKKAVEASAKKILLQNADGGTEPKPVAADTVNTPEEPVSPSALSTELKEHNDGSGGMFREQQGCD